MRGAASECERAYAEHAEGEADAPQAVDLAAVEERASSPETAGVTLTSKTTWASVVRCATAV